MRIDRSPRITCSEPSIGAQATSPVEPHSSDVARRLVTSIHSPSLTPVWISVRTAWPFLYAPAEGLVAAMDEGGQRQCPDAGALDDHLGVGVHAGQELAAGVGQVDLGAERAALDVEGPGGARDRARNRLRRGYARASTVAFVPIWT